MIVLSSAIKKTDRHSARVIRFSFKPVGYSKPLPLVKTLDSSACASVTDMTLCKSESSSLCVGAGEGDLVGSLVDWSVSMALAFSVILGEDVEYVKALSSVLVIVVALFPSIILKCC